MADQKKPTENPRMGIGVLYIVGALLLGLVMRDLAANFQAGQSLSYSEFMDLVAKGEMTDVVVGADSISGTYQSKGGVPTTFVANRVDPEVAAELRRYNVHFSGATSSGFLPGLIAMLLPTAVLVFFWWFIFRPNTSSSGVGGLTAAGRSRARVFAETDIKVTFADVAGVDEAKQELAEVVGFLKDPHFYGRLGARIPKGVLLVGPPGTGKTLLARAVAGEAAVPFFSITGSEFVEMFVGVGAARVRDLFQEARKQAPAIVFIDELDALGRARGIDMPGGGHEEKEQTLNQLLAEMDGFDPSVSIVVLAATNRPEILDPALLRAGRFDRQVLVDRPDRKGRVEILRVHAKKITMAPNVQIETIASLTAGFTGADLANLVNEAALVATRRGADSTTLEDFMQAIERIIAGLEKKSRILNAHEREVVAHHEMGHALVAIATPGTDPVQKVSIIPRGIAGLGYTIQRPTEDRFLISQTELANRMAVLLGGRAAEALVFGEVSTGAADDLAKATDIAHSMAVRFGMTPQLGQVVYEPENNSFLAGSLTSWRPRTYGDSAADEIDRTVKALIETAFQQATRILERNRLLLVACARELLARETLNPEDLAKLTTGMIGESEKRSPLAIAQ
jgi:cell division protease FtsH